MDGDLKEKIYFVGIIIFFSSIIVYSTGILQNISKILSEKEPIATFDISSNQLILPEKNCEGSIEIENVSCTNGNFIIKFKNNGNHTLSKNFIIILESQNITAYHGISLENPLKPNEEMQNEFRIKLKIIKSIAILNTECPNIMDRIDLTISC